MSMRRQSLLLRQLGSSPNKAAMEMMVSTLFQGKVHVRLKGSLRGSCLQDAIARHLPGGSRKEISVQVPQQDAPQQIPHNCGTGALQQQQQQQ